mgnify:CR=1 FL=1
MPSLDEQINQKLNEELQKVKDKLITFNSIENLNEKVQQLEEEIEKLKSKKNVATTGNVCLAIVLVSHYFDS